MNYFYKNWIWISFGLIVTLAFGFKMQLDEKQIFTHAECSTYVGQASLDSYDMGFLRGVHCREILSTEGCRILLEKTRR